MHPPVLSLVGWSSADQASVIRDGYRPWPSSLNDQLPSTGSMYGCYSDCGSSASTSTRPSTHPSWSPRAKGNAGPRVRGRVLDLAPGRVAASEVWTNVIRGLAYRDPVA